MRKILILLSIIALCSCSGLHQSSDLSSSINLKSFNFNQGTGLYQFQKKSFSRSYAQKSDKTGLIEVNPFDITLFSDSTTCNSYQDRKLLRITNGTDYHILNVDNANISYQCQSLVFENTFKHIFRFTSITIDPTIDLDNIDNIYIYEIELLLDTDIIRVSTNIVIDILDDSQYQDLIKPTNMFIYFYYNSLFQIKTESDGRTFVGDYRWEYIIEEPIRIKNVYFADDRFVLKTDLLNNKDVILNEVLNTSNSYHIYYGGYVPYDEYSRGSCYILADVEILSSNLTITMPIATFYYDDAVFVANLGLTKEDNYNLYTQYFKDLEKVHYKR